MTYWLVLKHQNVKFIYVSGTDEYGHPKHTENEGEAWEFSDFNQAMSYFNLGYIIAKKYK